MRTIQTVPPSREIANATPPKPQPATKRGPQVTEGDGAILSEDDNFEDDFGLGLDDDFDNVDADGKNPYATGASAAIDAENGTGVERGNDIKCHTTHQGCE